MEEVVAALETAKQKADDNMKNNYADEWALLPGEEMGVVWAVLAKYRET
jgi:hypothetical protein